MRLFPESWRVEPASSVCSEIVDCLNKTAPTVEKDTGLKMIRTTNVKSGRINLDDVRFVEEKVFLKWTRRLLPRRNDIVLTREAPLGEVGLLRADDKAMLGQRTMVYRADGKNLDQIFLYYSLLGPVLQAQIRTLGSGSTVEHMRVPDAETLAVPLPQLAEQRKIAALLSAYDDLIENNRRRIALLERMAEQLYREWFVRFRFPAYQQAEFEKGVPKDWSLEPLSKAVRINPTERPVASEAKSYVGMEDLSLTSMYFSSKEQRTKNAGSKFRNRDVLFPRITPSLENGKRGFVMGLKEDGVAVGSTEFIVLRERLIGPEQIYFLTCSPDLRTHAEQSMVGASGRQRVQEKCFDSFMVAVPPTELSKRFAELIRPFFDQIFNLEKENVTLKRTRDLLLPRLISGKLRVDELDIQFPPSMQTEHA
jgi:type I restriction enzyme S subunit